VSRGYLGRRPALGALAALIPLRPRTVRADDDPPAAQEEIPPAPIPEPVAAPAEPQVPPTPPLISALELQALALVNGARTGRGLPALEWDPAMAEVARAHAADMMRRGVVSHTGGDGSSPVERLRRAGVKFQFGSENIWTYWGNVPEQGPSTMHAAMMAEPFAPGLWNHIGNILYAGYQRIGIGVVTAPGGVQYMSETFAD
jgi:uncharacterized protein YkwD